MLNHRIGSLKRNLKSVATAPISLLFAAGLAIVGGGPQPPQGYIQVDGVREDNQYAEARDSADFSVVTTGALTVSAWMRPDALQFTATEGGAPDEQYVHWLGKGETGRQEWTFRIYSAGGPRENRISFYVFHLGPGRGCGSYAQDPIEASKWIHVVGVADDFAKTTTLYKNGQWRHTDSYASLGDLGHGSAPLRFGTRDFASFLYGGLAKVRIWNRILRDDEIAALYASDSVPQDGLVGEYLLDEGDGDTIFDTAGGNDGMLFGATRGSDIFPLDNTTGRSGGGC